ncbi:MAG: hypothetical protein ABIZ72_05865, partial [Candidatus Limnocylindrales bacterium]
MLEAGSEGRHGYGRSVLAGVVVVLLVGSYWVVGTTAADPDVAAVQALAVDTLTLEHTIGTKATSIGDAAQLYAHADAVATSHYIGKLLATRLR